MAHFIAVTLIRQIADHHDAHPSDYKEFQGEGGLILETREGGWVVDAQEVLSLEGRISDVVLTLEQPGFSEAKLVIGDGSRYVWVCIK